MIRTFTMTRTVTVEHAKNASDAALRQMVEDIWSHDDETSGVDGCCGAFVITLGPPEVSGGSTQKTTE